jgi:hypothetical protein
MKRWAWGVLAVLTAAASGPATAEWVSIGDQGPAEVFIDKTTITRTGDMAKMWTLQELKTPGSAGGAAYVSLKRQDEFDCKEPRTRGVQIAAYPQPKGEGKPVASEKGSGSWSKIVPGSTNEVLWKIACAKE